MTHTFDWVEIRTADIQRTGRFYADLFGWQVMENLEVDGTGYWIFDTGNVPRVENLRRGAFWLRSSPEAPRTVLYVQVEDIDVTLRKVVELGGEVVCPKVPQGSSFRAEFRDPGGNLLALWQETG